MSVRAQVIINLPSLKKMLLEDVAWVSYHCPKQARAHQHRRPGPEQQRQIVAGIRYASVYLSTAQCGLGHELQRSPTKQEMRSLARQHGLVVLATRCSN